MKKLMSASAKIMIIFTIVILISLNTVYTKTFATVEGTVKSEDGKPIAGAKVILIFSEDGKKYELTTDKKGIWRKANVRPGAWTIGFMAEGYKPQNINIKLSAIKKNMPIDIKLSLIPKSPLSKGDVLYQEKKYAEALQEYQRVLVENQDLFQAYEKIGLCYYRLDDLDKAIENFKLVLEKEPQSRDTLINLSAIYFQRGELEEGMKYFNRLDENSLTDPSLFYNIGILLFNNGEVDLAIDNLRRCIQLDSNYVNAYYQLALADLNKGDTGEARRNFQKVIELAPESEKAELAKKLLENIK
ncbi:MAG: tetratricopeptide repeat protein [Candidatus Aminicenantes bacterium]|nr:MAG: tetratricopeptide repeat protein [Candidatus Aminicenantes bacterium]